MNPKPLNPKKGPIKTTVLLKRDSMGFLISLEECIFLKAAYCLGFRLGIQVLELGFRAEGGY